MFRMGMTMHANCFLQGWSVYTPKPPQRLILPVCGSTFWRTGRYMGRQVPKGVWVLAALCAGRHIQISGLRWPSSGFCPGEMWWLQPWISTSFSCKRRHFCPSCHQKRVVEFGEFLYGEVLKHVPHRQWVFSIPKRLRRLPARAVWAIELVP